MIYRRSNVALAWLIAKGSLLTTVLVAVGYFTIGMNRPLAYLLAAFGVVVFIGTVAFGFSYANTTLTVTDTQVQLYEQVSVFGVQSSACDLRDVEDVQVTKSGLLQMLGNYGTLSIQTAGTKPNFLIKDLADATGARDRIVELSTGLS